jgi:hypothetical protein
MPNPPGFRQVATLPPRDCKRIEDALAIAEKRCPGLCWMVGKGCNVRRKDGSWAWSERGFTVWVREKGERIDGAVGGGA